MLVPNGQVLAANCSTTSPLSWHMVISCFFAKSKSSRDAHQSGPPAFHCPKTAWLEPACAVAAEGGL